jgi:DNA-binding NtrC family response regulator
MKFSAANLRPSTCSSPTMPGMTGLERARQVVPISPELPAILCSGYRSVVTQDKVEQTGIKILAVKPFTIGELAGYVRQALDNEAAKEKQGSLTHTSRFPA